MKTFFKKCLATAASSEYENLSDIIVMLSRTGFDIEWTVKEWEADEGMVSLIHFVKMMSSGIKINRQGNRIIDNAFADKRVEFLNDWINDKRTVARFKSKVEELLVTKSYKGESLEELNTLYEILHSVHK